MKERDSKSFESLSQVLPNTSNSHMSTANSGSSAAAPVGQDRSKWLLECPEPPSPWHELKTQVKESYLTKAKKFKSLRKQPLPKRILFILQAVFPIFGCIGYATLAKLDPQYGLYTSVVPPLIYALMGTSREIAIGPVGVVSLLVSSVLQRLIDPETDPLEYKKLVLTTTFFAGIFQASFGIVRLGFLVDFLSHAAIVGFMGGAAIVIGLQQLKGLLGITNFTTNTDIVSVLRAVWRSCQQQWSPHTFILGCSFLSFILITRFIGKNNIKLFWLPAIAPMVSVVVSMLMVFLTKADEHGVKTVKHIKGGLNPISIND
ncbi:hypothetical protein N665_0060s0003 [Sinapis alba]|nr:hypothetical protein N665_0060s0003 [Sinapis alba]